MPLCHCVNDNIDTLTTAKRLLQQLNCDDYRAVQEQHFSSSVGTHFRHIIDHYLCFFTGLENGHINYDQRSRDQKIAEDRDYAIALLQDIIEQLEGLQVTDPATAVQVTLKTSAGLHSDKPVPSTIARELVFLQGHSTHHFALVAIILRLLDYPVNDDFGIAPSTRAYEQMLAQDPQKCAH